MGSAILTSRCSFDEPYFVFLGWMSVVLAFLARNTPSSAVWIALLSRLVSGSPARAL